MRSLLILSALANLLGFGDAQVQTVGVFPHTLSSSVRIPSRGLYTLPPMDNIRILARELLAQRHGGLKPYKFGEVVKFPLDIKKHGEWSLDESGTARVWRAKVESAGALSMSVRFSEFYLPPNSEFYVIGQNVTLGAFTGRLNNKVDGLFSTAPIHGDSLILEYWEAISDKLDAEEFRPEDTHAKIIVESFVHGFRKGPMDMQTSGSCNIDVACPGGNGYRDQINSVAVMITDRGQRFCTGTILNNPRQDGRQLFLTANHCLFQLDMTNFIVGFNYQHKTCASGGVRDPTAPTYQTAHGLRLLGRWDKSDFALFEVVENIPDSYNVFYAGWSRDRVAPANVACIHHPSGDVKKISRYLGQTIPASWSETPNNYHWQVPAWTSGVTEPGSSGSPLFNNRGLVVGHLHGGLSSCQSPNEFDVFGALWADWNMAPSLANRISQFLDPDNKKVVSITGSYYTSIRRGPAKEPLGKALIQAAKEKEEEKEEKKEEEASQNACKSPNPVDKMLQRNKKGEMKHHVQN